jgi:hypothetical protein
MSTKQKNLNQVTMTTLSPWRNQWNAMKLPAQEFLLPSLTSPDMSMTLVEIIDRFATSGATLDIKAKMFSDGDEHDMDIKDDYLVGRHWESFDLDEKHEIIKQADRDWRRINDGITAAQKQKGEALEAKRKATELREKQFDEWLKTQKDPA